MSVPERLTRLALIAAIASADVAPSVARAALDGPACGPQVIRQGHSLVVSPTGGDDTSALQCALDNSQGLVVELTAGEFHVAQLVAKNFTGRLVGAGMGLTTITNLETPLPVTAVDYWRDEPSSENPWPALIAFVDGSYTISDLSIWIRGATPTTGWSSHGFPTSNAFAFAITITGTSAVARVERIDIRGEDAPDDPLFGLNLINGIYTWSIIGSDPLPLAVRLTVRGSEFRHLASALPVTNLRSADVSIVGNRFEDGILASEVVDLVDTRYVFAGNEVGTLLAIEGYDFCAGESSACGVARSSIQIAGNRSSGPVVLHGTFHEDVRCRVVGNTFDVAEPPDVVLGPGTHDCLVAGTSDVMDEGDNRVVP